MPRNNWLNPPEWTRTEVLEFPGSPDGPWRRYIDPTSISPRPLAEGSREGASKSPRPLGEGLGEGVGIGTVRYPRLVPKDEESAKQLARRTLTNLYNERPTWLDLAHRRLDEAVAAAYGWPADLSDEQILQRLLELNLSRESAKK